MLENKELLYIDGGMGKHIAMSSSLVNYLREEGSLLLCSYPEIFEGYDLDDSIFSSHTSPFDLIRRNNLRVIEPYNSFLLYRDLNSLSAVTQYMLKGSLSYEPPTLMLSEEEREGGRLFFERGNKPLLLFQPFGASTLSFEDKSERSLKKKFAETLVNELKNSFRIVQVKLSKHQRILGTEDEINMSFTSIRTLFGIASHSSLIISCDSLMNHVAASLNKKGIVLWANTSEKIFGHPSLMNIREHEGEDFIPINLLGKSLSSFPGSNDFSSSTLEKILSYVKENT
jgi:ADP-heptose:LPS heptosyltransferase